MLATEAILLMPPMIIIQSKIPKKIPVNHLGTENSVFITSAILLICGILPDPIAVIIIKKANKIATVLAGKLKPNALDFRPCSI